MAQNKTSDLLTRCIGREIRIPYLFDLCPAWQIRHYPYNTEMEDIVNVWREKFIQEPKGEPWQRNVRVDPCLLARGSAPDGGFLDVAAMCLWSAWVYYYDDALDFGEFDNKPKEADECRREAMACFSKGVYSDADAGINPATFAPKYLAAQSLYEIGVHVRKRCISASLKAFIFKSMDDYTFAAAQLQSNLDHGKILDMSEYFTIRLDSSAVYPIIGLAMVSDQVPFPDWFFENELVKEGVKLANDIVWLSNDIVSARFELQQSRVDNILPLLVYHHNMTIQGAVDETANLIRQTYEKFQALEPKIIELGIRHNIEVEVINSFLSSCKNVCCSVFHWYYWNRRYTPEKPRPGQMDVFMTLGEPEGTDVASKV